MNCFLFTLCLISNSLHSFQSVTRECVTRNVTQCREEPYEKCRDVVRDVCREAEGQECHDKYDELCETKYREEVSYRRRGLVKNLNTVF